MAAGWHPAGAAQPGQLIGVPLGDEQDNARFGGRCSFVVAKKLNCYFCMLAACLDSSPHLLSSRCVPASR